MVLSINGIFSDFSVQVKTLEDSQRVVREYASLYIRTCLLLINTISYYHVFIISRKAKSLSADDKDVVSNAPV